MKKLVKLAAMTLAATAMLATSAQAATYTWYSQYSPNWTTTNLDKLYATGWSTSTSVLEDIKDAGCVMSSFAMVLNNLGEKTDSKYTDIRTKKTEQLKPDPFVLTWANMGFKSISYNNTKKRYEIGYSAEPVYVQSYANLVKPFGRTVSNKITLSGDAKTRAKTLASYLKQNPEGIIVRIANSHTLVFNSTTFDEKTAKAPYEQYFRVSDPATGRAEKGNNVPFNQSYSYGKWGGLTNLNYLMVIN
jgi:hypothetical protein